LDESRVEVADQWLGHGLQDAWGDSAWAGPHQETSWRLEGCDFLHPAKVREVEGVSKDFQLDFVGEKYGNKRQ
jgi:hypothetical protein